MFSKLRLLMLALSFELLSGVAMSQPISPVFDRITVEDGLSHGTITAIIQGREGLMWFGTFSGLNRYDGYEFKVYKHNDEDSTSIRSDALWDLMERPNGSIWIATKDGIDIYNPKKDHFSRLKVRKGTAEQSFDLKTYFLLQWSPELLLIATDQGVIAYRENSNETYPLLPDEDISVRHIRKGSEGKLWIATENKGLMVYDFVG